MTLIGIIFYKCFDITSKLIAIIFLYAVYGNDIIIYYITSRPPVSDMGGEIMVMMPNCCTEKEKWILVVHDASMVKFSSLQHGAWTTAADHQHRPPFSLIYISLVGKRAGKKSTAILTSTPEEAFSPLFFFWEVSHIVILVHVYRWQNVSLCPEPQQQVISIDLHYFLSILTS